MVLRHLKLQDGAISCHDVICGYVRGIKAPEMSLTGSSHSPCDALICISCNMAQLMVSVTRASDISGIKSFTEAWFWCAPSWR